MEREEQGNKELFVLVDSFGFLSSSSLLRVMDSLLHWPEPIVRVQSLSDSGIRVIPSQYVKPSSDRPTTTSNDFANNKSISIPVIDLAGLTEGAAECRAIMKAISDACMEWGFFQVVNHGVKPDLLKKAREVWRRFFNLPMDFKQAYANNPKTYEGYGSRLGVEKEAILDWVDYYFLHFLPPSIKGDESWPTKPSSCREISEEYGSEVVKLCEMLLKVMSINLGLKVDALQKAFGGDKIGACMRVNFYPKCPQPDLTLGLSAHSDPGGLTVLLADDYISGLQIRKGDTWVIVHPIRDSLVINIGDQIQVLSNAVYKSVEHRVVVNNANERVSLAFFYNPRSDLPLAPANELVTSERPPLYQPMTFNEYRTYVRKKGPRGKMQVESLKSSAM